MAAEFKGKKGRGRGKPQFKKKVSKSALETENIKKLQQEYSQIDAKKVQSFNDFPLSNQTKKALKEAGYEEPTEIQKETLSLCLRGLDILGAAKTGSGKTLAFLIPLLEKLFCLKWTSTDGLGALVITPTRELAYQIFESLRKVGKYHDFSAGLVIGGKDLKFESSRLQTCNIIICTPGRIKQHLDENPNFDPTSMKLLVLDEADRILDMGFSADMNAILENLPKERQTLLFSATQTRSVKDLARLSLDKPVFVSVHEHSDKATPDKLAQFYIVCPLEQKINMLWSFIKNHRRKKILVFMQCCKQVKYVHEAFKRIKASTTLLAFHGKLHQLRRMAIYDEFCQRDSSIVLLATDVAARGLDFPSVDWVIQMDCPEDAKTYLHRAGRTARHTSIGQSMLVLQPSEEEGMIKQLEAHKIPIEKIQVDPKKVVDVQRKLEAHLASDSELKASAQRAFRAYLKSIFLLRNKGVFDVFKLDTDKFANSLGLAVPPRLKFLENRNRFNKPEVSGEDNVDSTSGLKTSSRLAQILDSDDEDEAEDILTIKRKDHQLEGGEVNEYEEPIESKNDLPEGKIKVITKTQMAKKVLKKNIQANQKITFDDATGEGTVEGLTQKKSEEGKKYDVNEGETAGIDLVEAKAVLKAEDKFDRELAKQKRKEKRREEKRKAKENSKRGQNKKDQEGEKSSDSDGDADNLDWLPDPDKIYGKNDDTEESSEADSSDENESGDSDSDRPQQSGSKRKWKPPKKAKKFNLIKSKKPKADLSMDEQLALSLLRK